MASLALQHAPTPLPRTTKPPPASGKREDATRADGALPKPQGESSASCTAALSFGGETYYGTSLRTHPPYTWVARISAAHMHEIGSGEFPPCRDTNHSTDQVQSVQVARIDGVDPGTAVAVLPHGDVLIKRPSLPLIQAVLKSAHGIRWDYSS